MLRHSGLFAGEDGLDVGEFVEGLEGGKGVDVYAEDFVTDGTQHGVVKLEETELYAIFHALVGSERQHGGGGD